MTESREAASDDGESEPSAGVRTWLIRALVPFPVHYPLGPDGGLPQTLTAQRRVPYGDTVIESLAVSIAEWPDDLPAPDDMFWSQTHAGEVRLWVSSTSSGDALAIAEPVLEYVLDALSFQMHSALAIRQLEVVDITSPASISDTREMMLYPFPNGYTFKKYMGSTHLGNVQALIVPLIPEGKSNLDPKAQNALDWYLKSLHAGSDSDQFILLWITLEILTQLQASKISEKTVLRCGHQVDECPTCAADTSTYRQGVTMRSFIQSLGVEETDVSALWWMRQIVHGARRFSDQRLDDLSRLSQLLRALVVASLKAALGIPAESPPLVGYGAPAVGPAFGLGGERALTESDLRPAPTQSQSPQL